MRLVFGLGRSRGAEAPGFGGMRRCSRCLESRRNRIHGAPDEDPNEMNYQSAPPQRVIHAKLIEAPTRTPDLILSSDPPLLVRVNNLAFVSRIEKRKRGIRSTKHCFPNRTRVKALVGRLLSSEPRFRCEHRRLWRQHCFESTQSGFVHVLQSRRSNGPKE